MLFSCFVIATTAEISEAGIADCVVRGAVPGGMVKDDRQLITFLTLCRNTAKYDNEHILAVNWMKIEINGYFNNARGQEKEERYTRKVNVNCNVPLGDPIWKGEQQGFAVKFVRKVNPEAGQFRSHDVKIKILQINNSEGEWAKPRRHPGISKQGFSRKNRKPERNSPGGYDPTDCAFTDLSHYQQRVKKYHYPAAAGRILESIHT